MEPLDAYPVPGPARQFTVEETLTIWQYSTLRLKRASSEVSLTSLGVTATGDARERRGRRRRVREMDENFILVGELLIKSGRSR
jgi:hypothetical protein